MIKVLPAMRQIAAIFVVLATINPPVAAQDFVPGFEDLPLMEGLRPITGSGHIFDSPSGRLIEIHARGPVEHFQVEAFYRKSLKALGWTQAGAGRYRRDNEILRVEASKQDGGLNVVFRLAPDHH